LVRESFVHIHESSDSLATVGRFDVTVGCGCQAYGIEDSDDNMFDMAFGDQLQQLPNIYLACSPGKYVPERYPKIATSQCR